MTRTEELNELAKAGICPCCFGTGDEDGTGDACGGENCCYCSGEGCGGSCSWCSATGRLSGWSPGNPSYRGIISDDLLPVEAGVMAPEVAAVKIAAIRAR